MAGNITGSFDTYLPTGNNYLNSYVVSDQFATLGRTTNWYFLLAGAGGNGMSSGGGSGGVIYGTLTNIYHGVNIYFNIPSGGGGRSTNTFIYSAPIGPGSLPAQDPYTNIPFAWAGDDGGNSTGGAGGYGDTWTGVPLTFTGQPITIISLLNGNDGTSSAGGGATINFTDAKYSNINGAFGIGGAPAYGGDTNYGSSGLFVLDVEPINFTVTAPQDPFRYNPDRYRQSVPCFPKGTTIMTPEGYKAVETLEQGSLVTTSNNKIVPIKNIYKTIIQSATVTNAPYLIPKHSLGSSPAADLRLSPQHAFQVRRDVWVSPKYAAELTDRIQQYGIGELVTYYHVECPNFFKDNLIVDGTVVESYGINQTKGMKAVYVYSPALKAFTRVASRNTTHHRLSQ